MRYRAITILAALTLSACGSAAAQVSLEPVPVPPAAQSIPADQTKAIQSALRAYGYTIVVDGIYGPQTTKVVQAWQRSNGLLVDGIAGPITQGTLGLNQAARQNNAQQVATPPQPDIPNYDRWVRLAQCESGGNWSINTGNGYYGGLQFALTSWRSVGGTGYPHEHPAITQMAMAERLLKIQGWRAWPGCSRKFGWI